MNLFQFTKLMLQHYVLVLGVPLFLAGLVYYLTMGEEKVYSSNTYIYTGIASGVNVDFRNGVGDRFMVQSVFENILSIMKSKEVKETVALKLIAQHLSQNPEDVSPRICTPQSLDLLNSFIPKEDRDAIRVKGDFEKTYQKVLQDVQKDHQSSIYRLVHSKKFIPYYSILALNGLQFKRVKTSDLIQISFKSTDPGVTLNTLLFFSETFIKKYRFLKVSETNDIVAYFEEQLRKAQTKLDNLEATLLTFRSSNNILDYTEQVRAIAQRRQEMEGEIYNERMSLASAEYSSDYSKNQLDMHFDVLAKNTDILAKKKRLEALAGSIALFKAFDDKTSKDSVRQLESELNVLRQEMEGDLDAIFAVNYSTSGVKSKDLLKKWFENVLNIGSSKAKLHIFEQRQDKFKELYRTMAPIGSNLTKIEREVAIAEGSYLRILEALNVAKMRQQNISLSTKLQVVDAPLFPTVPDPSKRKLLVIIGFLVGGALIVGILVLLEFLNQSIRNPLNVIELTGLKLATAFPFFPKRQGNIYYQKMHHSLVNRLIEGLDQHVAAANLLQKKPKYIFVCSMQEAEGKTFVAQELSKVLIQRGAQVTVFLSKKEEDWQDPISYAENETTLPIQYYETFKELSNSFENQGKEETNVPEYTIVELPYLQSYQAPHSILRQGDCCLMVTKASRAWTDADNQTLENIHPIFKHEPMMVLNGVRVDFMEEIIGKIPKKRSRLRMSLRQLLRLEFKK